MNIRTVRGIKRAMSLIVVLVVAILAAFVVSIVPANAMGQAYEYYDDVPLGTEEQEVLQKVCDEKDISYEFALAMLESESNYNPDAKGDQGRSVGYFQINKANWSRMKDTYGLDVHEPLDNLAAGVYMLAELADKYADPYEVIICYKAGEGRGKKLYERGVYKCKSYNCEAIMEKAEELERAHGK